MSTTYLSDETDSAVPSALGSSAKMRTPQEQLRRNLHRFLVKNRLNLIGTIIVIVFFLLALFGQLLAPYDPYQQDITGSKLLPPSVNFWLSSR